MVLVKTSIFWSQKDCLLSKISKNDLYWHNFFEKQRTEKVRFLDKIHGLTRFKNLHLLALFKTSIFWSKNDCFLSKISKNDVSWHNFCEKQRSEKVRFLNKIHGLTPFKNIHFWPLLKLQFFGLKIIHFYPKYGKTIFSDIVSVKNSDKRKFHFSTKSMD